MNYIKQALRSDTIKVATIQGIAGILIAIFTEFQVVGGALVVKTIVDYLLRAKTILPLSQR